MAGWWSIGVTACRGGGEKPAPDTPHPTPDTFPMTTRQVSGQLNPGLKFVGAFHGRRQPDGRLEGAAEEQIIVEINRLSPDYIWVGFGTPKQQVWVKQHKPLIRRGVILTVGFAFDVNAGMKPDAPPSMQRIGLICIFRLCSQL